MVVNVYYLLNVIAIKCPSEISYSFLKRQFALARPVIIILVPKQVFLMHVAYVIINL